MQAEIRWTRKWSGDKILADEAEARACIELSYLPQLSVIVQATYWSGGSLKRAGTIQLVRSTE